MAIIDFPNPPLTVNQTFAAGNGATYKWNGTMWITVPGGGGGGEFVLKAGDTMTGDLHVADGAAGSETSVSKEGWLNIYSTLSDWAGIGISQASNAADQINFQMQVGAGGNFLFWALTDAYALQHQWAFNRDGTTTFPGALYVTDASVPAAGDDYRKGTFLKTYEDTGTHSYIQATTYNNSYGGEIDIAFARGTPEAPLAVQSGDWIGQFGAVVHNGTQFFTSAGMEFYSAGAAGANVPTNLQLFTAAAAGARSTWQFKSDGSATFPGPLTGTSATFSDVAATASLAVPQINLGSGGTYTYLRHSTAQFQIVNNAYSAVLFAMADSGAAAFSGPLTGTSATFGGNIITNAGYVMVDRTGDGANASIYARADAGFSSILYLQTGTLPRWLVYKNAALESGSNVGSDFAIVGYDDAGVAMSGSAITMARSTGYVAIGSTALSPSRLHVTGAGQTAANFDPVGVLGSTIYVRDTGAAVGNGGSVMFGNTHGPFATIKGHVISGTGPVGDLIISNRRLGADATFTEQARFRWDGLTIINSTGTSGATSDTLLLGRTPFSVAGTGSRLYLSGAAAVSRAVYIEGVNATGASQGHDLVFGTSAASAAPIERMRINSNGALTLGGSTLVPISVIGGSGNLTPTAQFSAATTIAASVQMYHASFATPPTFNLSRSKGTTVGSHAILAVNDALGNISFNGSDGVSFRDGASIRALVDGTPGVGDMPTRLAFYVSAAGSSAVPTEALRINSDKTAIFAGNVTCLGALTGTTATFNSSGRSLARTGGDVADAVVFSGATKGIRFGFTSTYSVIEGVDSSGVGSYQPLFLNGTTIGLSAPLTGTTATFTGNVASTVVSATEPASPLDRQLWFNSDASVGGGQLMIRYNDGSTTQWIPASPPAGAGTVVQTVSVQTGAVATGTTLIPLDDTIPQITEGTEFMTCSITPKSATSKLVINVHWCGSDNAVNNTIVALFRDATADALSAAIYRNPVGSAQAILPLQHTVVSGSTSPTTFRVRVGGGTASTTTFNGSGGTRYLGGVMASSIVIQEVL